MSAYGEMYDPGLPGPRTTPLALKIYVASHCRWAALHVASVCGRAGHEITSRWIYKEFNPTEQHTEAERRMIADEDCDDVKASNALILISGPERYPGGKFVEAGVALALCKHICVIGRRENMLLWHSRILCAPTPEIALDMLERRSRNLPPM